MQIILMERVAKLGQMGDIVDVKSGYARNFLLPNKIGLRATEANIQIFEGRKVELETKNLESKASAEKVKAKLKGKYFILLRSASDAGALYGSVSSKDICTAAASEEVKISKNQVVLEKPIKENAYMFIPGTTIDLVLSAAYKRYDKLDGSIDLSVGIQYLSQSYWENEPSPNSKSIMITPSISYLFNLNCEL